MRSRASIKIGQVLVSLIIIMGTSNVSHADLGDETKGGGGAPEQECDYVSRNGFYLVMRGR